MRSYDYQVEIKSGILTIAKTITEFIFFGSLRERERERERDYLVQIHDYQGPIMRDIESEGEPRKT